MLHEVLVALVGCPGYLIRARPDGYELAPGVAETFLHPAEASLVAQICALGHHFRALEDFVARVKGDLLLHPLDGALGGVAGGGADEPDEAAPPRIYLRAVAMAVDVVLQAYAGDVAEAERVFLEDPALPLSHLQYLMRAHALALPAAHALVREAEQRSLRGGQLVDELQRRSLNGVPCIEATMRSLLDATHRMLLHQMTAWMVHGLLDDRTHHEFFVQDAHLSRRSGAEDSGGSGAPIHEWHSRFSLRVAMLPGCIPPAVAEKVLFIGKAMRVLTTSASETGQDCLVTLDERERFAEELGRLLREAPLPSAPVTPERGPDGAAAPAEAGVLPAENAGRISFNRLELQVTVEGIRGRLARHLWQLVVVDSELLKPLQGMRDYFLLGRGDLYQYFIEDCNELTQIRPAASTAKELNVLWRAAGAKAAVEEDDDFKRLAIELQIDAGGGAESGASQEPGLSVFDAWRRISLSMTTRWPLNLLLDESMQMRYNELFPLLFTVKRVQMALHAAWRPLCNLQRSLSRRQYQHAGVGVGGAAAGGDGAAGGEQEQLGAVLLLRRHMAFVVDNLHYYLQVDVIDAAFSKLRAAVLEDSADFESVVAAHAEFLTVVSAQCFLHQRVITQAIHMLLESALAFCAAAQTTLASSASFFIPEVSRTATAFESQVQFLFKVLHGAKVQQSAPHLARLLLRLDYSQYYSSRISS